MALKFSTGLCNAILGTVPTMTAATIAQVAASETLTDSGNAFITEGFFPGMWIMHSGFTGGGLNGISLVNKVEAGTITCSATYSTFADDAAGESVTITAYSQAFRDIFANHIIRIYSGSAPADADDAETGVLLLKITLSSGALTAGTKTNGINFEAASAIGSGVLSKDANVHSGVGLADGTAGYYRMYTNLEQTGASTTAIRLQGTVGTSGAQLILSSTSIVTGATITLDTHDIDLYTAAF